MKTKYVIITLIMTLIGNAFFKISNNNVYAAQNDQTAPAQTYINETNLEQYYTQSSAGSVTGLKGDDLLEQLAKIMILKHRYYTSYGECRGAMAFADEDPNDPSKIITFYAGVSIDNTWGLGNVYNREHVWCKSLSGGLFPKVSNGNRNAGTDIHQLKPTISSVNSARGNSKYADLGKSGRELKYNNQGIGCYEENDKFEPRDGIKGDVARILMYMYTHYSNEIDNNSTFQYAGALNITNIVYTSSNTKDAAWDLLLKWNELDPVDEFEIHRNNYCASITGVRNPYIDHPEYATLIWGDNPNVNPDKDPDVDNKTFDVKTTVQLGFSTDDSYTNFQNYKLMFKGSIDEDLTNYEYGGIFTIANKLTINNYQNYQDALLANENFNNLKNKLNATTSNSLEFTINDINNLNVKYAISFYFIDKTTQKCYFSDTKFVSYYNVINIYLSNTNILNEYPNKNKIISALTKM